MRVQNKFGIKRWKKHICIIQWLILKHVQVFAHSNLLGTPSLATELKILCSVKALLVRSGECKQTDDSSWHPETKEFISNYHITCKTLPENDNKMRCISLININRKTNESTWEFEVFKNFYNMPVNVVPRNQCCPSVQTDTLQWLQEGC